MGERRSTRGRRLTILGVLALLACLGLLPAASALDLPARHDDSVLWAGHHKEEISTASARVPVEGGVYLSLRIERRWIDSLHVGGSSSLLAPQEVEAWQTGWDLAIIDCETNWVDCEQTWYGGDLDVDMFTTTDAGDRRFTATAECGEVDVTWTADPEERQLPGPPPDDPGRSGITLEESYATHRGGPTGHACGYDLDPHMVRVTETLDAGYRL